MINGQNLDFVRLRLRLWLRFRRAENGMIDFLEGVLIILLSIKVLMLEHDVKTLYRSICWLDGTKAEREIKNDT